MTQYNAPIGERAKQYTDSFLRTVEELRKQEAIKLEKERIEKEKREKKIKFYSKFLPKFIINKIWKE